MKLDRSYAVGIISIVMSGIGLILWYISYLSTRDSVLSRKINSALDLLSNCGFDSLRKEQVEEILLQAKKSLDIDENYNQAADLINSINWDLRACNPTLEANADLMLITILIIIFATGMMTIVRHYRETHNKKI